MSSPGKREFTTPVMRLLQGDPFKPDTTNMQGQPLVVLTGPNAGQKTQRYLAVLGGSKQDPAVQQFVNMVWGFARECWPQFFNQQGQCINPLLSVKLSDGDGLDGLGKPNNMKEGFAGNWILKTQSSFPPKCYYKDHYQPHEEIKDPNIIKRGYFVRVAGTMETNNNQMKPGIYVNLNMVELCGHGPEIISGPQASSVFGAAPAGALPMGATALPAYMPPAGQPAGMGMMANTPANQPVMQPMGNVGGQTGFAQTAVQPGMAQPQNMAAPPNFVQPNAAILQGPGAAQGMPGIQPMGQPQMAQPGFNQPMQPAGMAGMQPGAAMQPLQPLQPMQPAAPQLTPAAIQAGYTYQSLQASGQNDAQLRAGGYLV